MAINNLEKTFGNNSLVYCNLNNEIIVECICLTELYLLDDNNEYNEYDEYDDYNEDNINNENKKFVYFMCDKVKIITIYDIYKNIIYEPIQTDLFKDPIKIGDILENLNEKKKYYFKTFIGAFLINNKLNGIKYDPQFNSRIFAYNFSYDNIHIDLQDYEIIFTIYNNNKNKIYTISLGWSIDHIYCYETNIDYYIYDNIIVINIKEELYNKNISFFKKDLKVFEIEEYYKDVITYYEKRNYNNEIIHWEKRDNNIIKENFISNNIYPPFSKPLKKYCIELINHYNNNINNFINICKPLFKKTSEAQYNLLLNYNLEMINSK